jgi:hypothetical protein
VAVTPSTDTRQATKIPAQRREPPDLQRAALAWQDPFEGVSLLQIARMIPQSARRTWRIAWLTDRWMLVVLLAAQVMQGLAAAVMLLLS